MAASVNKRTRSQGERASLTDKDALFPYSSSEKDHVMRPLGQQRAEYRVMGIFLGIMQTKCIVVTLAEDTL